MKKQVILFAALFAAVVANAQTTITVDEALGTPSETKTMNDPLYKGVKGMAFIGDARSNKEEGKEAGLTQEKATKYFKVAGKTIETKAGVNFQKAPSGLNKKGEIQKHKVPYNRAVELKPTSDGKLYAMVWSKKPQGRLFFGVANNGLYELKGLKMWEKGSATGSKDNPFEAVALDYEYKEGDVVFLFSSGTMYLNGVHYTGTTDATFEGGMPKELVNSKKMAKEAKKRKAAAETATE